MENFQNTRFICEMCDKDFANKANLKRHQEIHGDKRICPKCDATFSTTEGLRKHMKIQHEQAIRSAPQPYQSTDSQKEPAPNTSTLARKIASLLSDGWFSDTIQTNASNLTTGPSISDVANIISKQDQQTGSTISPARQTGLQLTGTDSGPSPRKEKTSICSVCPKGYTTSKKLIEHIKLTHPDRATELITIASKTSPPVAKKPLPPKKQKTFVNPQKLPTYKKRRFNFEVNDRILTPVTGHGTLRYKGGVDFARGMWAGVELDRPVGFNDGSVKDKRYFQCRQNHGLFLPLAKLTKIQVSTMAKDRTNSGNVHVHDSSPGNTAQPFPVESKRKAPDSFASGLTQSHYGSSNILSQQSPGHAMKRSAPLRCNNCEGCERNLKGEDCQECRYCKDKKKYGGPDKLRKPCEKRKCTVQIRPSLKDNNDALHTKRTLSEIAVKDKSISQEPSMKKKKVADSTDWEYRFNLKLLEKEQAEKKMKRSEKEKERLEKSIIQARASANKFKTDLDKMEIENTFIKKQITDLQQELKHSKETEQKLKVQKEILENQMRSLEAEKCRYQQMMQTKQRVEREFSELKTDKEKMVTEITQLKTDKVSMYREIAKLKIDKDKIKEQFDQTQAILLNDLKIKSLRKTNEKLLKVKSEPQSVRNEDKKLKQDKSEIHQVSAPPTSYSGPYCDICDVTEHNTEDCPQQTFESVSPDRVAQIEYPAVSSIPEPVIAAIPVPLAEIDNFPIVYFDLETTGLGRQSHITQIAAKNTAGHSFDRYIIPKKPITNGAAKTSRNTIVDGQFYHKDIPVLAITISQALREFFFFIGDSPVILSGHNIKTFDCHILLNAVKSCGMQGLFEKKVGGFLDTISLFRCRTMPSYKQEELYARLIGGTYDAHNALEDVKALEKLINKIDPSSEEKRKHTFSVQYVLDVQEYNRNAAVNLLGWKVLFELGVISKNIAQKAAKSGLRPEHLELSYKCAGEDGVYSVLSELTNSGYRVTKDSKISKQLSDYFENKLLGLI